MNDAQLMSTRNKLNPNSVDNWRTPQWFFDYVKQATQVLFKRRINIDVAADSSNALCDTFYDGVKDLGGLRLAWSQDRVHTGGVACMAWCNPPYSKMGPWVDKAIAEAAAGRPSVLLYSVSTDSRWFSQVMQHASRVELYTGRIKFVHPGTGEPAKSPTKANGLAWFCEPYSPLSHLDRGVHMVDLKDIQSL